MPVVTVAVAPHAEERDLLTRLADAIADALELATGDVIAMSVPVRETVSSGAAPDAVSVPWVLISIHGSDRGAEKTRRACEAARIAAADWSRRHGVGQEGEWCEWLLPQHP